MQEYINELKEKAGLTAEQAKKAIETIVAKVKSKVPESLHGSIDSIFSGQASDTFQQKARSFSDQAEESIKEFSGQAREQISKLADEAEEIAGDMQEKAEQMMKGISDKVSGMFGKKTPPSDPA
jgi:uncharacterized protein YjbJ (UPF0337 family)